MLFTQPEFTRAARNLTTEHGTDAEKTAVARANRATESNREDVAGMWRDIAAAVRKRQGRTD
jgi:hypothetical protein